MTYWLSELSGYLAKLENDYCLISRYTPMFQKTNCNIRYQIEDNFLRIWFRYIYKYGYMIEVGANKKLKMVMDKNYTTYTGKVLERYFIAKSRAFLPGNRKIQEIHYRIPRVVNVGYVVS